MTGALRARVVCGAALLWSAWVLAHAYRFDPAWQINLTDVGVGPLASWKDAAYRAARGVAGASLVWLAAWQLGRRVASVFGAARLDPAFVFAIGTLAVSQCLLLMAAVHAYRAPLVLAFVVVCSVSRPIGALRDLRAAIGRLIHLRWRSALGADAVWWVPAIVACGLGLVAALAPEIEYDALWYHLWLPEQWLAQGRLVDIVQEYPSLYPGGWELLNGAALAAGGPVAAKLLHFACLPLAAWAGTLVARELAPAASRSLVVALIVTAPTMLWESSTAYVDLALAWFVTMALVAAIRYHRTDDTRWRVVGALMVGGAMAIKHLAIVVFAMGVLWLLAREAMRAPVGRTLRSVLAATLIALSIPAPWYARAWRDSGNPVFPEMYRLFGARPADRWSSDVEASLSRFKERFGMGRTPSALARLPWDLTVHGARFGGTFGPLFLLLAPFACLARNRRQLTVLLAGTLGYIAVWASPIGSLQLRFLLPVVPALAVLAAVGGGVLVGAVRRLTGGVGAAAVRVAIVVLLVVNLPPFMNWHDTDRQGGDGWLTHVLRGVPAGVVLGAESTDDYLARSVPTYRAWREIDARTAPDARVLTFAGGDHLYSHRARLPADAAMATPITWGRLAGDESRMIAAAEKAAVSFVLFDRRETSPDFQSLAIASAETRRRWLAPFYDDGRIEVLRFVYPGQPDAGSAGSDR